MSGAKHTPGPWRWADEHPNASNEPTWSLIGADGTGILSCDVPNSPQHATGRDAALIEAAPDLLAVAKRIEAWEAQLILDPDVWTYGLPKLTQELYDEWIGIQAELNAALKKARGES